MRDAISLSFKPDGSPDGESNKMLADAAPDTDGDTLAYDEADAHEQTLNQMAQPQLLVLQHEGPIFSNGRPTDASHLLGHL